jgi:type I restriction enzyme, S subunit
MDSLIDDNRRTKQVINGHEVWNLNLDQIEPHSGRVLSKQFVNANEIGPSTYAFDTGTVLYSKLRPYLNKVVVADAPGMATTELVPLRCNEALVTPIYLGHFLRSPTFLSFATNVVAGAKMPRMVMSEFWRYPVPVPPLPEQRRIAAILDQAETLRIQRRTALALLDTLTQSIFLDMFGDPAKNPNLWPVKALKELGKVITGGTPPSSKDGMFDGPIPFVTPGDLESDQPVRRSLTEAGAKEVDVVRAGSTLVCCIGATIGKVGMALEESAFNQQLNAVVWGGDVNDHFGYEMMRFFKPTIVSWGASTTLPILKKSSFERIEIPVPPMHLQEAFANRLRQISNLKELHKSALVDLGELFGALQCKAFAGEL